MRKLYFLAFALFLTLIIHRFLQSYNTQASISSSQQLKNSFLNILENSDLNCAALIAVEDELLLSEGFGYANRETNIKNTPDTQFLIGSITKVMTAAAVLKLVDEGKIQEAKPISTYLPPEDPIWAGKVPSWTNEVTVHDLLTHSSGLKEYIHLPHFDAFYESPHTTEELIQFFSETTLKFKPGSQFEYSGTGYNLLGAIIERVANVSYGQFLKQNFFEPLGMNSSFAPHTLFLSQVEHEHPSLAIGYVLDDGQGLKPSGDVNLTTAFAEASVISTARDLYTWTQALFSSRIISKESLNKMIHPYLKTNDEDVWMGYGLFIDRTDPHSPLYCHSGRINGYESFWCYQPKHHVTVIILSNEMGGNIYKAARALLEVASKRHSLN